jgi:flagellar export protein FliJ
MKRFQFPLQRVLEWRSLQMRSAEEQLARLQEQLAALVHRENALRAAELKAEVGLLDMPVMDGADLQSLAAFQVRMRNERAALQASSTKCHAEIAQQRMRVLAARRDFRVLEKLKEKRLQSWIYLSDREIENTAAEAYLSGWARADATE